MQPGTSCTSHSKCPLKKFCGLGGPQKLSTFRGSYSSGRASHANRAAWSRHEKEIVQFSLTLEPQKGIVESILKSGFGCIMEGLKS